VTPAPLPDWFAKVLAVFHALSGWVLSAIALSGVVVLYAPISTDGVDLTPIRGGWGGWILAGTILSSLLALARFAQWMEASIQQAWQRRATLMEMTSRGCSVSSRS
jgi:hypothetical protein